MLDKNAIAQLHTGFAGLADFDPGLPERAVRFIADGVEDGMLAHLRTLPETASGAVGFPSAERRDYSMTQAVHDRVRVRARVVANGRCNAEQLIRMGTLLEAIDGGRSLPRERHPLPDWWHYLAWELNDVFETPKIGGTVLAAAMTSGGMTPPQCLLALFEPVQQGTYSGESRVLLAFGQDAGVLHSSLHAWRAGFLAALPLCSSHAKLNIARTVSDPVLLASFGDVLGLLSMDADAGVESLARKHIAPLSAQARAALRGHMFASAAPAWRQRAAVLAASDAVPASGHELADALAGEADAQVRATIQMAQAALGAALSAPPVPLPPAPPYQALDLRALGKDAALILDKHHGLWRSPGFTGLFLALPPEQADLRSLAGACAQAGLALDAVLPERDPMSYTNAVLAAIPAERVWPFCAEHPDVITRALLLRDGKLSSFQYEGRLWTALQVAALLPAPLPDWLVPLFELALYGARDTSRPARQLLSRVDGIGAWVARLLASDTPEQRDKAIGWVAELGYTAALPALRAGLDGEHDLSRRVLLLSALDRLGEDMSPYFGPDVLLRQAQQELQEKIPANLAWFPFDALPPCRWLAGGDVDPAIIKWWVVLAHRLKDPAGNALLDRYLTLLTPVSAATLGSFVLTGFIKFDTRPPSEKAVLAYAEAQLALEMRSGPQPVSADEQASLLEKFKRKKLRECVGSAVGAKGVLALAHHAPGHEIAARTRAFMRDYHTRLAQIEALLELLAHAATPAALQLLLAISQTYRKAPIKRRAGELIAAIAARKGWSEQQLSDRSVPTAGFDENGIVELEYGERRLEVRLNDKLAPLLYGDDGIPIKALPAPRKHDDPESVKAAKLQLSACKKELKQVIERQRQRLHESMCIRRRWPAAEWRADVLGHPILGRLAQQLIWEAVHADGIVRGTFRPASDQSLNDAADDAVQLAGDDEVRLAHATLMDGASIAAWQGHFADYKLLPLFAQLSHPLPAEANNAEAQAIEDRQGWVADAYRLGGAFEKRGYVRGDAGDGGMICEYRKSYPAIGMAVEIGFTGVFVQGGNAPAALTDLRFRSAAPAAKGRAIRIAEVPPVLLAEAYADYLAVADACNGFDSDWRTL